MKVKKRIASYPLRLEGDLREWATKRASKNKRSLNAELNLLIEKVRKAEETQQA